jgi:hypothetical protein
MSHLLLSHLSKENNSPELVESLYSSIPSETRVIIAGRFQETALYQIPMLENNLQMLLPKTKPVGKQQLSLF